MEEPANVTCADALVPKAFEASTAGIESRGALGDADGELLDESGARVGFEGAVSEPVFGLVALSGAGGATASDVSAVLPPPLVAALTSRLISAWMSALVMY